MRICCGGARQAGGDDAKQTVVRVLRRIADAKAEEMLRRWLLRRDESDDVKNWVLYGLHEMGAEQPYLAYLSGKVTEVRMGRSTVAPDKVPDAYDQILRELLDLLEKWEKKMLLPRAVELFAAYLQTHTRPPMLREHRGVGRGAGGDCHAGTDRFRRSGRGGRPPAGRARGDPAAGGAHP